MMTRIHSLRYLSGALFIGVLAAAWLLWPRPPGKEPEPAAIRPQGPVHQAVPAGVPLQVQAQAQTATEEPRLSVQVERLLATRTPQDAYTAYLLVAHCAEFNLNRGRVVFDQEEPGLRAALEEEARYDARRCSGMTERERQSRLDYLAIAAEAGLFGAAVTFANEGPFGDPSALQTRPHDPLVQAWRATANALLTQSAEAKADLSAIAYLAETYEKGSALAEENPLLAYRYRLAENFINSEMLSPDDSLRQTYADQREQLSSGMQDFSPDQRAAELAAARRMAEVARKQREQAARKPAPGG